MFYSILSLSSMNKQAKICMAGRETDFLYTILFLWLAKKLLHWKNISILLNIIISHKKSALFHASLELFLKLAHYVLSNK